MTVPKNIRDFSDLICLCLSDGWEFTQGPPSETQLQQWAARGRAELAFKRPRCHPQDSSNHSLHLIRCKEETRVRMGHTRWTQVGLWTAWLDTTSNELIDVPCRFDRV